MQASHLQRVYDQGMAILKGPGEDMDDYKERVKKYWYDESGQNCDQNARLAPYTGQRGEANLRDRHGSDIEMRSARGMNALKITLGNGRNGEDEAPISREAPLTGENLNRTGVMREPPSDIVDIEHSLVSRSPRKPANVKFSLPHPPPISEKRSTTSYAKQRGIPSDPIIVDFGEPGPSNPRGPASRATKRMSRVRALEPPPLKFIPLAAGSSPKRSRRNGPIEAQPKPLEESFIEDPSEDSPEPVTKEGLPSSKSKLLEDIKQRKANSSASSKQPKPTLRQGKTARLAHSSDRDSIASGSSSSSRTAPQLPDKPSNRKRKLETEPVPSRKKLRLKPENLKLPKGLRYIDLLHYLETEDGRKFIGEKKFQAFKGFHIFFVSEDRDSASDRTKNRVLILLRYGATLAPTFNASTVTHILSDTRQTSILLRAVGLKRLRDIPAHIPTLEWSWVIASMNRHFSSEQEREKWHRDNYIGHGAFADRLEAGTNFLTRSNIGSKVQSKEVIIVDDAETPQSHISGFIPVNAIDPGNDVNRCSSPPDETGNGALPSPPSSPHSEACPYPRGLSSSVAINNDTLAEFYQQAIEEQAKERDTGFSEIDDTDDEDEHSPLAKPQRGGWTCDDKEAVLVICPNQDVVDKLRELKAAYEGQPAEHWRVFSYSKAIRALLRYPRRILSVKEAQSIRGIGASIASKIMEVIETGELRKIESEMTDDVKAARLFRGVYGVGLSTAHKWIQAGCQTLEDLRQRRGGIKLTSVQRIGLEFYDDINDRMPRDEAKAIYDLIEPIALSLDPKLCIDIMGSYRRGKATCGDIDILITRPPHDGKTHAGILQRLLHELHAAGILTEDLALPEETNDDLEGCYRGLCRLPGNSSSRRRRIDFLTVPYRSRGAALIYYTGDDIFNRAMRMKANKMGYSLNQRGLYRGVVRDTRDRRVKLDEGQIFASETEEDIFRALQVPWQEPHERVRAID